MLMFQEVTPSPWMNPAFLVGTAVALIGLVAWFVRLEGKTDSNKKDIDSFKEEIAEKYNESKKWRGEMETKLLNHMMDTRLHYNDQFMSEFRQSIERRFEQLEKTLVIVNSKLDRLDHK